MDIQEKNKIIWSQKYSKINIDELIKKINNFDSFLNDATATDISWVGMYLSGFRHQLKGKRILELGCGNGLNACIMERLGATVIANDISDVSRKLIRELKNKATCKNIEFLNGDFFWRFPEDHLVFREKHLKIGRN